MATCTRCSDPISGDGAFLVSSDHEGEKLPNSMLCGPCTRAVAAFLAAPPKSQEAPVVQKQRHADADLVNADQAELVDGDPDFVGLGPTLLFSRFTYDQIGSFASRPHPKDADRQLVRMFTDGNNYAHISQADLQAIEATIGVTYGRCDQDGNLANGTTGEGQVSTLSRANQGGPDDADGSSGLSTFARAATALRGVFVGS
jgi:hypothetical protein